MKKPIKIKTSDIIRLVERKLIEENEAEMKIPESCFGGPKTGMGGLILFTQILQKESDDGDTNSEKLLSDMKTFLKGLNKVNPEILYKLLKKYNKMKYLPWVGCL